MFLISRWYDKKNDLSRKVYSFPQFDKENCTFLIELFHTAVCVFILLDKMMCQNELNLLNNLWDFSVVELLH